jgi:hypothetical protein
MFVRLITKTNHPYNDNPLTLDEFNSDYKELNDYIEWRNTARRVNSGFGLYNFTNDNMTSFLNLINFDTNNNDELLELWRTQMINLPSMPA